MEASPTQKFFCRGVLIAVLSVALAIPARANVQTTGKEAAVGIVVVAAAVAVIAIVLVLRHKPKQRTITGCVNSGAGGMSLTDEKDQRVYALSGDTTGVKPGDRMTLDGNRKDAGSSLSFETRKISRDFGACQP